ncbi:MAG: hypothetical protein FJW40_00010 [Acidobacteria bacterium]|nr:hypothetical protein [Acidobacteriota bacterium]
MSVLIQIRKQKAFLRDGVWRCASRELEDNLNSATRQWIDRTGGPPISDSDPERTTAKHIASVFNARVLMRIPVITSEERQRYLRLRQMNLFD